MRDEYHAVPPQNYVWPSVPFEAFCNVVNKTPFPWAITRIREEYQRDKSVAAYGHMPASAMRHLVHPEMWNGYFKFCVERAPLSKIRSFLRWSRRSQATPSLNEFLKRGHHSVVSDFPLYADDGAITVDQVLPYENMSNWWPELRQRLSSDLPPTLPHLKASSHLGRSDEEIDDVAAKQISIEFAREFELFGYARKPTSNKP